MSRTRSSTPCDWISADFDDPGKKSARSMSTDKNASAARMARRCVWGVNEMDGRDEVEGGAIVGVSACGDGRCRRRDSLKPGLGANDPAESQFLRPVEIEGPMRRGGHWGHDMEVWERLRSLRACALHASSRLVDPPSTSEHTTHKRRKSCLRSAASYETVALTEPMLRWPLAAYSWGPKSVQEELAVICRLNPARIGGSSRSERV